MSRIYLPTSQQMDTMNEKLELIARAVGSQVDISTWAGIQRAVRAGIAPQILPIGTQLEVAHSVYGNKLYDVVAHNYLKSIHDPTAPTMTLLSHELLVALQFDAPEAFYYADAILPAGTYNFTIATTYSQWAAGTYEFTTTVDLPAGGQFTISGYADVAMTARKVYAFSSRTNTTKTEECVITEGTGGTSLGTFGVELNHPHRVSYGSNNYKESAVRQFLLSSAAAGSVWTPQTKFDRPPSWATTTAGFAGGLDNDFLSIIGEVTLPCCANNTYEAPDSTVVKNTKYTLNDRFYLASLKEIFGTNAGVLDDSAQFPFYVGSTNADRIKYRSGSATYWWLRTPSAGYAHYGYIVSSDGSLSHNVAVSGNSIAPACTIV